MTKILALPVGCIAAVISFTSPRDACRLACVSTTFRTAADSDVVWECFLPPEHSPSLSFWLDHESGKKCYMISARELIIKDSDIIYAWTWFSVSDANADIKSHLCIPDCRFSEVIIRGDGCPFEIGGKITASLLSPMTTYVAYLVIAENRVDYCPAEVTVELAGSNNVQNRSVYIHQEQQDGDDDGLYPKMRAGGWLETELGEFFNEGDEEDELLITIVSKMKQFLVVEGIEIRPKKE
ncbi:hypothetical protein Ddye_018270 [Dipteronia dyeriana]|uniref:F-box domain-containing protein n=1 Tax=Dipteronia dyeriana TaxID=168575 RepID=A0AAD9UAR1_9ROSI|nr:hypothetical protein Ddye_018270 [Dipteronia dyeriana]